MLARHRHQQEGIGAVDPLEAHVDAIAARLVARRLMRTASHVVVGADRLQDALAVLPDEDAGAERAKLRFLLVHPHAPAAATQRDRGGKPGEPCSCYLGMHARTLASSVPSATGNAMP